MRRVEGLLLWIGEDVERMFRGEEVWRVGGNAAIKENWEVTANGQANITRK